MIAQRLDEQLEEAREELDAFTRAESELQSAEQRIDQENQEAAQKIARIQQAITEASGQKQAAASRLRVLREMERDYAGYQQAVKQVLLHARGNSGVRGVVASLMQVCTM